MSSLRDIYQNVSFLGKEGRPIRSTTPSTTTIGRSGPGGLSICPPVRLATLLAVSIKAIDLVGRAPNIRTFIDAHKEATSRTFEVSQAQASIIIILVHSWQARHDEAQWYGRWDFEEVNVFCGRPGAVFQAVDPCTAGA